MNLIKDTEYEVYVTKYALTQGIQKRKVYYSGISEMMCDSEITHLSYHKQGRDWHFEWFEALKKAEEMKSKKIASLEKQLKKVRNFNFNQGAV